MLRFIKKIVSNITESKNDIKNIPTESKQKLTQEQVPMDTQWGIGLPAPLMRNVLFGYHTFEEAKNFSNVSDDARDAYRNPLLKGQFVEHVAKGEQDAAEKILQDNPTLRFNLLSQKASVKDHSGRTFFNVTALQYAAWALDRHMWTMLKKYMSEEEMEREGGVEYQLTIKSDDSVDGKPIIKRELHYDFNELIERLQNYVNKRNRPIYDEYSVNECKLLGYAQGNVPAHVANEYCRPDRSFATVPNFKEDKSLPRTFRLVHPEAVWYSIVMGNGELPNFAIFRGVFYRPGRTANLTTPVSPILFSSEDKRPELTDLAAMKALYSVRTLELAELKKSLFNPATSSLSQNGVKA